MSPRRLPIVLKPVTVTELLATKPFQDAGPQIAAYAAWLICESSAVPHERFAQAFEVLNQEWPRWMGLYAEGVAWNMDDFKIIGEPDPRYYGDDALDEILVTATGIYWAPYDLIAEGRGLTDIRGRVVELNHPTSIPLVAGEEYISNWRSGYGDGPEVVILKAFEGDGVLDQSNRSWARARLINHIIFVDDHDIAVIATQPVHPDVLKALDRIDTYPILDENDYSEREREAFEEAWRSDGRSDFSRALIDKMEDYFSEYLDPNFDYAAVGMTEAVTPDQLDTVVRSYAVDAVWENISLLHNEQLYIDDNSGGVNIHIHDAMRTLDSELADNDERVIAPVLIRLGILIDLKNHKATCMHCGVQLKQSDDLHSWIFDDLEGVLEAPAQPDRCAVGSYVGEEHFATTDGGLLLR